MAIPVGAIPAADTLVAGTRVVATPEAAEVTPAEEDKEDKADKGGAGAKRAEPLKLMTSIFSTKCWIR